MVICDLVRSGHTGIMEADEALASIEEQRASPTEILLDPEGTMGKKYDARVTPHMFIIDPSGTVRYNGAIDDKQTALQVRLKRLTITLMPL